jgi:hypothetical protein
MNLKVAIMLSLLLFAIGAVANIALPFVSQLEVDNWVYYSFLFMESSIEPLGDPVDDIFAPD